MEIDFKFLANKLLFDISEKEEEELKKDFLDLEEQINIFNNIDTENVEEMVRPNNIITKYMRKDEINHVLELKDVLKNVEDENIKYNQIAVKKAIK